MADRPPRPHDRVSGPLITLDLAEQLAALRSSEAYRRNDHASTTLVNRPGFGAVLVALPQGGRLKEHRARRSISIHVLGGRLRVDTGEEVIELQPGGVTSLAPGLAHRVTALEESAFLLTMGGEAGTG